MNRGVIAAPGIIHRLPRGFRMERSLSPEEIRFYVLYWDRVVIPGNNLVYIGIPEEEDLVACQAVERPRVQYSGRYEGDQVANAVIGAQAVVASQLSADMATDWALHQFGGEVLQLGQGPYAASALRIQLASVLPVPPASIPIAEVLEFRERKAKQLASLHDVMDGLYQEILASPDQDLAQKKTLGALGREVAAVGEGLPQGRTWPRFDLSIDFSIKGDKLLLGAIAATALSAPLPLPAGVPQLIGGALSMIEVKLSSTKVVGQRKSSSRLDVLPNAGPVRR